MPLGQRTCSRRVPSRIPGGRSWLHSNGPARSGPSTGGMWAAEVRQPGNDGDIEDVDEPHESKRETKLSVWENKSW